MSKKWKIFCIYSSVWVNPHSGMKNLKELLVAYWPHCRQKIIKKRKKCHKIQVIKYYFCLIISFYFLFLTPFKYGLLKESSPGIYWMQKKKFICRIRKQYIWYTDFVLSENFSLWRFLRQFIFWKLFFPVCFSYCCHGMYVICQYFIVICYAVPLHGKKAIVLPAQGVRPIGPPPRA